MKKWPKSSTWKHANRKDWTFESGYKISAFKYPESKGFEKNKWEIIILLKGKPSDPPQDLMENILDDYRKYGVGRYGYLHDPDLDRIVRMIALVH